MSRDPSVYDDRDYEPRHDEDFLARRAESREARARDDAADEAMDLDARRVSAALYYAQIRKHIDPDSGERYAE